MRAGMFEYYSGITLERSSGARCGTQVGAHRGPGWDR